MHPRWVAWPLILLVVPVAPRNALAVPAAPFVHSLKQPEGTRFPARLRGDERFHWWETTSAHPIVRDESTGQWRYARPAGPGRLSPSDRIVTRHSPPSASWRPVRGGAVTRGRSPQAHGVGPVAGTSNVPVILINFPSRSTTYTPADFTNLLFGSGNSMRAYYSEVSYGQFTVSAGPSGVAGWYTSQSAHNHYGQNDSLGEDLHPAELVIEAVQAADAAGFNFAPYDRDGDGYVDVVSVIHQGTGEETGGAAADIWSHQWDLTSAKFSGDGTGEFQTNDGVKVNSYVIQPELLGNGTKATVGVFCHEYGHILGLPDLYDADYSSNGLGNWSLMAGGGWNATSASGDTPAHLDAWCKTQLGWMTPTTPTEDLCGLTMPEAEHNSVAYKLPMNGAPATEYFLLENRAQTGFDAGLPGSGLLIYHVDDSRSSNDAEWYPGKTDSGNYLVALVQADGLFNLERAINEGDASDPFPGTAGIKTFDLNTTPNSRAYSGNESCLAVREITKSGSNVTADITLRCGAPPDNDRCSEATVINSTPYTNTTDTTAASGCDDPSSLTGVSVGSGVWYQYTPAAEGRIVVDTVGSSFDTVLAVYTGACGSLTEIAGDNNGAGSGASRLSPPVTAGVTYHLYAGGVNRANGSLTFNLGFHATPPNDRCDGALVIGSVPYSNTVDITGATGTGDPAPPCGVGFTNGVWYRFTAVAEGHLSASTAGSDIPSSLTVYTGSCESLVQVACSGVINGNAPVSFAATPGVTYWFLVGGPGESVGSVKFNLDYVPSPANDQCGGAVDVVTTPYTNSVDTSEATDTGDPSAGTLRKGVWYRFTPPTDGIATVDTSGSSFDTVLAVFTGACDNLTSVGVSEEGHDTRIVAAGTTYWYLAGGSGGATGLLKFNLSFASAPANDRCDGAIVIGDSPYSNTQDISSATDLADPTPCGWARGVWYQYTPTTDGNALINTAGSNVNTVLAAFTGSCGNLSVVECRDDQTDGTESLSFSAAGGTTYWIMVGSSVGLGGTVTLNLGFFLSPTVTSITPNVGVNNGTVAITDLAGLHFLPGAQVKLTRAGQPDLGADSVTVVTENRITCSFDLTGRAAGAWNVVVTNPGEVSGSLVNGFTILGPPTVEFTAASQVSAGESGVLTVTAQLSAPTPQEVTVPFTVNGTGAGGADYTISASPITVPAGSVTGTVSITILSDSLDEPDETVIVTMGTPTNATLGATTVHTATITDDNGRPTLSLSNATVTPEGNSGVRTAVFTVSLSTASGKTITVDYVSADGTATGDDYTGTAGTLTFAPGSASQSVTVTTKTDVLDEEDEIFYVNLSNPTNASIAGGQGAGTIVDDDDPPAVSIDDVTVAEGNSGTTIASFTVSLSSPSGKTITVVYATANGTATGGSDYTAASGNLTFLSGTTSQKISVTVLGDTTYESDETFLVNLSVPTNATLSDSQGQGTITNDDLVSDQPDLMIKSSVDPDSTFGLDDTYQATPSGGQIETQTVPAGTKATHVVKIQNDGSFAKSYLLKATETSGSGWTVTYKSGVTVLTTYLKGAGWSTPKLAPGSSVTIIVEMTPASIVAENSEKSSTLAAFLDKTDPGVRDSVRATTLKRTVLQPDALIKRGTEPDSAYALNDVYQTSPSGDQIESQSVAKGVKATHQVRIQNDGNTTRTFRVKATETVGTGWTLAYKVGLLNVTTAIKGTGRITAGLKPGASETITVEMIPGASLANGASKSATLQVFLGSGDVTVRDAAQAITTVGTTSSSVKNEEQDLAVVWITSPPDTMAPGMNYHVWWQITGGRAVSHTYVVMSADPDPTRKPLAMTEIQSGTTGTYKAWIPAPSKGHLYYQAVAIVEGKMVLSEVVYGSVE